MATYRGKPIQYAVFNRKADTYSLIGDDETLLVVLSAVSFYSFPNRQSIEVRDGRYRAAGSKDQRSANRKSGQAGRDDPFAFTFGASPFNTIARAGKGAPASMSLDDLKIAMAMFATVTPMPFSIYPKMLQVMMDASPLNERPALKREGIVAGEIIGYRCWRVQCDNPHSTQGLLRSVYQNDLWRPFQVLEGRELGDWDSRGIHAWKDPASREYNEYLRSYLKQDDDPFTFFPRQFSWPESRPAMVTGTVFLWGDVVEHERGWRAEFARVRSLDWLYPDEKMMGREQQTLDDLRARYGVRVAAPTRHWKIT